MDPPSMDGESSAPWWQDEEISSCCYFYKCMRTFFCVIFQLFGDISINDCNAILI